MKKRHLVGLPFIAALSLAAHAAPSLPKSPTVIDVTSTEACASYVKTLKTYFDATATGNGQGSYADLLNSVWCTRYSDGVVPDTHKKNCSNGQCTNDYASIQGCAIAGTASTVAKQVLLKDLTTAYQQALKHDYISGNIPDYYTLSGPKNGANICTNSNNYANCVLVTNIPER